MGLIGKANAEKIWNYPKAAGLSDCGEAGRMGNLKAESGLNPINLKTATKKAWLPQSVGDLEVQLDLLMKELSTSYKAVLTTLRSATTVKAASNAVLLQFERSANQSAAVQDKRAGYGQTYYEKYAAKTAEKEESTVATKITTAAQLAERCLDVAQNYKTLYVMGCFGAPLTAANKKRYTQNHSYNKQAARTKMINAASADTFGFDCVCLIKGPAVGVVRR